MPLCFFALFRFLQADLLDALRVILIDVLFIYYLSLSETTSFDSYRSNVFLFYFLTLIHFYLCIEVAQFKRPVRSDGNEC